MKNIEFKKKNKERKINNNHLSSDLYLFHKKKKKYKNKNKNKS